MASLTHSPKKNWDEGLASHGCSSCGAQGFRNNRVEETWNFLRGEGWGSLFTLPQRQIQDARPPPAILTRILEGLDNHSIVSSTQRYFYSPTAVCMGLKDVVIMLKAENLMSTGQNCVQNSLPKLPVLGFH